MNDPSFVDDDYEDDDLSCPDCGGSDHEDCECSLSAECGRWDQGAPGGMWPVGMCRLAGTEQCDFECPHRNEGANNER